MGADAPMMRARQRGHSCSVPGHGDWCEVSTERPVRERAVEKREHLREVEA